MEHEQRAREKSASASAKHCADVGDIDSPTSVPGIHHALSVVIILLMSLILGSAIED